MKSSCGTKRCSGRGAGNQSWKAVTMQDTWNCLTQETATDCENPISLSVSAPYSSRGTVYWPRWGTQWCRSCWYCRITPILQVMMYCARNWGGIRVIIFVIVVHFPEAVPSRWMFLWCMIAFLLTTPSNDKTAWFLFSVVLDSWSRNHDA